MNKFKGVVCPLCSCESSSDKQVIYTTTSYFVEHIINQHEFSEDMTYNKIKERLSNVGLNMKNFKVYE